MSDPIPFHALEREILKTVKEHGEARVTETLIRACYPVPDQMANAILIAAGHRPEPTPAERIARFCATYNLEHTCHPWTRIHLFRKKEEPHED